MRSMRSQPGAEGFTLIEMVVTLTIIVMVMTSMIALYLRSLHSISLARQRQQASALAARSLEELRALPYAVVTAGLRAADLAGDANIVQVSGVYRLRLTANGIDEPLLVAGTTTTPAPLNPHVATQTVDGVTYTVSSYVTRTSSTAPFTLTSVVSWSSNVSSGTRKIAQRSTAYSPSGCLSTATHPFAGPCQSSFTGEAGTTAASISVLNDADSTQPVAGFTGTSAELELPLMSSSLAVEQTSSATTRVATTEAGAVTGGTRTASGDRPATAATSSDPGGGAPVTATATTPAQTSTPVSISGTAGTLTATPSSADSGSAASAASSSTSCPDPGGTALPTGRPCTSGNVRSTGTDSVLSANLSGTNAVRTLGAFDLARVAAAPSDTRAVATRIVTAGSVGCPTTSGDGCAYASASRALGTVTLGGLPTAQAGDTWPAGYTSAVRVSGLTESARAEAGTGERTPAYTRSAGTLSYWNGSGMTSVDLATLATPATIDPPAVSATYVGTGGNVVVTADASITVGSATTTSSGSLPCTSGLCTRTAKGSAFNVTILYVVTTGGVQTTRFVVTATLGTVSAEATYGGAPSA